MKAIALLTRVIQLKPKLTQALLSRGNAYMRVAQAQRQIAEYTSRIAAAPDAATYLHRGFAYYNTGAYDRAIADYNAALKRRPGYPAAFLGRSLAHLAAGHLREALDDYDRVVNRRPDLVASAGAIKTI
jgi:tetratricopeptide (TPR) repeat protein